LDDLVAEISFGSDEAEITNIVFHSRNLRFKCQHCASLCCRLGGPPLNQKDIDRMRKAGYDPNGFSEPTSQKRFRLPKVVQSVMRNREDGSCVFLKTNGEKGAYECSIYNYRPALCRLYPFYPEVAGSAYLLKAIPCCRGLNNPEGELVDERFILRHLHRAAIDLLRLSVK